MNTLGPNSYSQAPRDAQFMRPPLRVQQPIAVILGSVPGRLDPNSVSVLTRYLYRCLTIKTKLVETDGFEPPRFLGARFTVWCNQPLCHISKISTGYLCVDKPLLGRLFIVRHFFVNVNVALSGFCNHPLRRPSVAPRLRMEFLDNLVHGTGIEPVLLT